jgi:hypothetical protein
VTECLVMLTVAIHIDEHEYGIIAVDYIALLMRGGSLATGGGQVVGEAGAGVGGRAARCVPRVSLVRTIRHACEAPSGPVLSSARGLQVRSRRLRARNTVSERARA